MAGKFYSERRPFPIDFGARYQSDEARAARIHRTRGRSHLCRDEDRLPDVIREVCLKPGGTENIGKWERSRILPPALRHFGRKYGFPALWESMFLASERYVEAVEIDYFEPFLDALKAAAWASVRDEVEQEIRRINNE